MLQRPFSVDGRRHARRLALVSVVVAAATTLLVPQSTLLAAQPTSGGKPGGSSRGVAALGCDGVSDVLPSRVAGVPMPIHSVAIVAMGLHLIDNLELEPLAKACAAEARWEFLLTLAPLVLLRGTASPLNPIAVF